MVDDAVKVDGDGGLGDGQLSVKGDGGPLRPGVVGDLGGAPCAAGLARLGRDLDIPEVQLESVDDDLIGGLGDISSDAVGRGLAAGQAQRMLTGGRAVRGRMAYVTEPL